jgi:hypothetical protein
MQFADYSLSASGKTQFQTSFSSSLIGIFVNLFENWIPGNDAFRMD